MNTNQKRTRRVFSHREKMNAVHRIMSGETKASVSRDIDVPESTLRGWCKNEDKLRRMISRLPSANIDEKDYGNLSGEPSSGTSLATSQSLSGLRRNNPLLAEALESKTRAKRTYPSSPLLAELRTDLATASMSAPHPFSVPYQHLVSESYQGLSPREAWPMPSLLHPYALSALAAPASSNHPLQSPSPAHYGLLTPTLPCNLTAASPGRQALQNFNETNESSSYTESSTPKKKPPEKRLKLCEDVNPLDICIGKEKSETQKPIESLKQHSNIWDKLLIRNSHLNVNKLDAHRTANGEYDAGAVEALENAEKFLAWLETSGDPVVTQIHIHQLRGLIQYLRSHHVAVEPSTSSNVSSSQ